MAFNPQGLKELLRKAIPAGLPVLVKGKPGIGKTEIYHEVCGEIGYEVMIDIASHSDPTDVKGLPDTGGEFAVFKVFANAHRALTATKPLFWFWDDVAQSTEATQNSIMHLFQSRMIGDKRLPDWVTLGAASNDRTHKSGVRGITEAFKSRFNTIVELEADIDAWSRWAVNHGVSPMLIAFLRYRPELLSKFEPTADFTNSPSPRTWFKLSQLEALGLSAEVEREAFNGAVGEAAATEYLVFRKMYSSLVNVDAILLNPDTAAIPSQPSELYAVSVALAGKANSNNFGRIARYCERMAEARHGEFAVLTVRSATDRDEKLIYTDAYVRLQSGAIGQLISGGN
jgi:hypothetical protein